MTTTVSNNWLLANAVNGKGLSAKTPPSPDADFKISYMSDKRLTFCVMTLCVKKGIFYVQKLLHFALTTLLHFASILLHFAFVLHFAADLITFCTSITVYGDYYILLRNSCQ